VWTLSFCGLDPAAKRGQRVRQQANEVERVSLAGGVSALALSVALPPFAALLLLDSVYPVFGIRSLSLSLVFNSYYLSFILLSIFHYSFFIFFFLSDPWSLFGFPFFFHF